MGLDAEKIKEVGMIKKKRKELGVSQKTLASMCNCSAQYICDIEKGRRNCPGIVYKKLGMPRVSKEFLQAMNGVLNGERWTCSNLENLYIDGTNMMFLSILCGEDMQATDWERIDEKRKKS